MPRSRTTEPVPRARRLAALALALFAAIAAGCGTSGNRGHGIPVRESEPAEKGPAPGVEAVLAPVGGSAAKKFFTPLPVTGVVRKLADGRISVTDSHQPNIDMGRVALFQVGPVLLLVSELRGLAGNHPDIYQAFGIEPKQYRMAVVKTASNFQYFAPITSRLIRVDTRGPGQSDVKGLPWQRLPRPIYPLDEISDRHAATAAPATGT
jgi:microcystin degradation protein MlrC